VNRATIVAMPPRLRDALFVLCACAGVARADSPFAQGRIWEWRAAHGNDALTEVIPPLDDQGITVDLSFALRRWVDPYALGGAARLRVLTERQYIRNQRRWDLLELFATADRRWHEHVAASARLGIALGGNYGGLAVQDTWHRVSGTGPTVEDGLQNDYDGDRTFGAAAGGTVRGLVGPAHARGHASLDLQGAAGSTGVSCRRSRSLPAAGWRGAVASSSVRCSSSAPAGTTCGIRTSSCGAATRPATRR
jgi:hypothetical protein